MLTAEFDLLYALLSADYSQLIKQSWIVLVLMPDRKNRIESQIGVKIRRRVLRYGEGAARIARRASLAKRRDICFAVGVFLQPGDEVLRCSQIRLGQLNQREVMRICLVAQENCVGFCRFDRLIEFEIARSNDSDGFGVSGEVANNLVQHRPRAIQIADLTFLLGEQRIGARQALQLQSLFEGMDGVRGPALQLKGNTKIGE